MTPSAADEEAIRGVLAAYAVTWNAHDMDAWSRLFTDDVDYVNRGGGWWRTNAQNVDGHRRFHDALTARRQTMNYALTVATINLLAPDVALVHATWRWPGFVLRSGEAAEDHHGVMTVVMVKRDGRWLIRALQNTVSDPSPPPSA